MFLFLSKLIPLFFYPLGLVCILMIAALVLIWKRPKIAASTIFIALLIILFASNGWVSTWLVKSLEWQNLTLTEIAKAEAIVILGGATKSAFPPRPSVDLSEESDRVFYGAQLYREGKAPLVIASGGRIEWRGSGTPESQDMALILQTLGVPKSAILQDPSSLNTYENAVNVKQILKQQGINNILLVTSAMHMPRSLLIFKRQGIEAIPAPTDFQVTSGDTQELSNTGYAIALNLLPETGRLDKTTRALKEYIGIVVYRLKGWI